MKGCPELYAPLGFAALGHKAVGTVQCEICKKEIPTSLATIGPLSFERRQLFACVDHLKTKTLWINGWGNYFISQNDRVRAIGKAPTTRYAETRLLRHATEGVMDAALHIIVRIRFSGTILYVDNAKIYSTILSRCLIRLRRLLEREKANTSDTAMRSVLEDMATSIAKVKILDTNPNHSHGNNIHLITPSITIPSVKDINTIFLINRPDKSMCQEIYNNLKPGSSIIEYRGASI
ncbi:MAG TPA: hypothetical protein VD907_01740 [Verrucomicrobiae bacterium]|nr:hypothetical protein [Verrucomicrobiae bacterium]